jgi:hypothetical protein
MVPTSFNGYVLGTKPHFATVCFLGNCGCEIVACELHLIAFLSPFFFLRP